MSREEGIIVKALSGFYYVRCGEETVSCRARGKFRMDGTTPLVGDRVMIERADGTGSVVSVCQRKNFFIRPAVANVDALVILTANVNPVTDPFLADRVTAIAEQAGCGSILCINKCDLDRGDGLFRIFSSTGYPVIRLSAATGEGIAELRQTIAGKTVAFTGNSGVGKSSVLNALCPGLGAAVGEVSDKLGRGKHTTRHIELFNLGDGTFAADTPGFASFDLSQMQPIPRQELQFDFPEFAPYIGKCRFDDCTHRKEPGCAVLQAVKDGLIHPSRHESYTKLYEICAQFKDWEQK